MNIEKRNLLPEHYKNLSLEDISEEVDGINYTEEWKDIRGYENSYQISSFGRCKALSRLVNHYAGDKRAIPARILKPVSVAGYLYISLYKEGVGKRHCLHILVGIYFVPNPNKLPEINHKKGLKTDNRATELEWSTHQENMKHAYDTKLVSHAGQKNSSAKLTEKDIMEIRRTYVKRKAGELDKFRLKYNVNKHTICDIVYNRTWKHLNFKNGNTEKSTVG